MNNGYDIYESDRLGLRIVADRGQWFVEVRPGVDGLNAAASQTWFTLEQWSSCLDAPVLFHDTRPARSDDEIAAALENSWHLEPQLAYLAEHLNQIEEACTADRIQATLSCVKAAQLRQNAFPDEP